MSKPENAPVFGREMNSWLIIFLMAGNHIFPSMIRKQKSPRLKLKSADVILKFGEEEKCCQELGYTYVSDNIGKGDKTILRDREAFEKELEQQRKYGKHSPFMPAIFLGGAAIILVGFVGIILLAIWLARKKKNDGSGNKIGQN